MFHPLGLLFQFPSSYRVQRYTVLRKQEVTCPKEATGFPSIVVVDSVKTRCVSSYEAVFCSHHGAHASASRGLDRFRPGCTLYRVKIFCTESPVRGSSIPITIPPPGVPAKLGNCLFWTL